MSTQLNEIEERFLTDYGALLAGIQSGAVHTFIGQGLYVNTVLKIWNGC